MSIVEGGCHCGLVRFEAAVPDGPVEVLDCDCSICRMTGYQHLIVPESDFRLVAARHIFCSQCGIKSFYKPRSHPDGISINLRCLDEGHGLDVRITAFDGRNH